MTWYATAFASARVFDQIVERIHMDHDDLPRSTIGDELQRLYGEAPTGDWREALRWADRELCKQLDGETPADPAPIRLTVSTGDRPMIVNVESKRHGAARQTDVDAWQWATSAAIKRHRLAGHEFERIRFEFQPIYPTLVMPDTAAIDPTEKAIIDACVVAGLIPDDNRWHNAGQLTLPPHLARGLDCPEILVTLHPVGPASRADGFEADHHPRSSCGCRQTWTKQQIARTNRRKSR